jgi:hypothetical protein
MMSMKAGMLAVIAATLLSTAGATSVFVSPQLITDGAARYQLTRNPRGCLVAAPGGVKHLVYWSGSENTTPSVPSFVYHRQWSPAAGWSAATIVDDSTYDPGTGPVHYGGRHPSAALAPDGTLWVVWHDHRHATVGFPGNSIDNLEIYADRLPPNGSFLSTDLRLTTSSAPTLGDNGYTPKVAIAPTGEVTALWYDFHFNDTRSDIFAKNSDPSGLFDLSEPMSAMRVTNETSRPSGEGYSIPDVAITPDGVIHAIWTSGFGGPAPIYHTTIPRPIGLASETVIATNTGSYFDPAKLSVAPNGDLWVLYTHDPSGNRDVRAMRRRTGEVGFDAPIALKATAAAEYSADLAVDSTGILHLVWIDERSGRHIYYGRFSADGALIEEVLLTTEVANWERPILVLDGSDRPFVVFERRALTTGDLYFTQLDAPLAVSGWSLY